MPVGPSTIAALPTPSLGHGRAATCTRGRKRRERQFVPKLTLQSTSGNLGGTQVRGSAPCVVGSARAPRSSPVRGSPPHTRSPTRPLLLPGHSQNLCPAPDTPTPA